MLLVSVKPEILHTRKLHRADEEKNQKNLFFLWGYYNIVKMESEIYKYLPY